MMNLQTNLFLFLKFREQHPLDRIVVYVANDPDCQLRAMGEVKVEQLPNLLTKVDIDYCMISPTDPAEGDCWSAFECSPKQIVDYIEKCFQMDDEIEIKILEEGGRGSLTEAEWTFKPPQCLNLYSSSIRREEGIDRILAWFNAN